ALPPDTPVVFEYTNELYAIDHYTPDLGGRCFFLDFERDQIEHASNHRVTTRDVARPYTRFRGRPDLLGREQFKALPRHYELPRRQVVRVAEPTEPQDAPQLRFPGFAPRARQAWLYELAPAAQAAR